MMSRLMSVWCRFTGRGCRTGRLSTRDIVRTMEARSRRADAQIVDIRRRREDLARTMGRRA